MSESYQDHWKQIVRSFGTVTQTEEYGETMDTLDISAWGIKIKVSRENGSTEPDYKALQAGAYHAGVAFNEGIARGKALAFEELRKLIGASPSASPGDKS